MNKKQGFIIATLLVLIVCAGILATKVNSPLYVNGNDLGGGTSAFNFGKSKDTSSKSDFFAETKLNREQTDAKTLQTLKSIIDDKNTSKENRDAATKKNMTIALASQNANKIESLLKGKGYEDSVCFVEDEKVRVMVKCQEKLTDKQAKEIKDIVTSITKIKDVEIEQKQ